MLLAIPVLVLLAVLVAILLTRRRRDPVVGPARGRLAQRVAQASPSGDRSIDAYVDDQAAVWNSMTGVSAPGRPALFREDVGRPDPRTPDAYDVSDLYLSGDEPSGDEPSGDEDADQAGAAEESFDRAIQGHLSEEVIVEQSVSTVPSVATAPSVEDTIGDLDTDYGWEYVEDEVGEEADRAFAADLDEVDDDPELVRFAPPRAPAAHAEDEFASELLGVAEGTEGDAAGTDLEPGAEAEPLEQRTSKVSAEISAQPFRLARTQQRPTGGSRRSPEQIRSFLSSYRRGIRKGREEPRPDAVDGER